jgi:hypothetical protein
MRRGGLKHDCSAHIASKRTEETATGINEQFILSDDSSNGDMLVSIDNVHGVRTCARGPFQEQARK